MRGLRFIKGKLYAQGHRLSTFQRYDSNGSQFDTNTIVINHQH